MGNLFIPEKIRVGYQTREGTYTGKLAYVIYYDEKKVLRKETSWESWRDKKIEPHDLDNTPQDGFVLNKGIRRYNWSHFGSDRSYIRIYDSRGIEFEITPDNLIGILTETDCLKRGLEGKFVYAWMGKELVLLPCSSEEYQKAKSYTSLQSQKISARDLKPGCSYTTKKGEEIVYIGYHSWFEFDAYSSKSRVSQKKHIFAHPKKPTYGNRFFPKSEASFLAIQNSPDPVQEYAGYVDEWNADIRSSVVVSWETSPSQFSASDNFGKILNKIEANKKYSFTSINGEIISFLQLCGVATRTYYGNADNLKGHKIVRTGSLNTKTMVYTREDQGYSYYYGSGPYNVYDGSIMPHEEIVKKLSECQEIKMVLASGKKIPLDDIHSIARS